MWRASHRALKNPGLKIWLREFKKTCIAQAPILRPHEVLVKNDDITVLATCHQARSMHCPYTNAPNPSNCL